MDGPSLVIRASTRRILTRPKQISFAQAVASIDPMTPIDSDHCSNSIDALFDVEIHLEGVPLSKPGMISAPGSGDPMEHDSHRLT